MWSECVGNRHDNTLQGCIKEFYISFEIQFKNYIQYIEF